MANGVKRQLSMVMDLNKCIGCHTCSVACKTQWTNRNGREAMWWNNVETQPGRGFPRDYAEMGGGFDENGQLRLGREPTTEEVGVAWEYDYEGSIMGGSDPWLRPNVKPEWGPNWDEDEGDGEYPNAYYFYLPRICNHCSNPACLAACSRNAIYKRQEDGIVLIDQERCRGYRYCVASCPYKKIYFNEKLARSNVSGAFAGSGIATTRTDRSTSSSTSTRLHCLCTRSGERSRTCSTCRPLRRRVSTRRGGPTVSHESRWSCWRGSSGRT
jgi:DMSO reductase family type II enzyme iron-sulfur subunit